MKFWQAMRAIEKGKKLRYKNDIFERVFYRDRDKTLPNGEINMSYREIITVWKEGQKTSFVPGIDALRYEWEIVK